MHSVAGGGGGGTEAPPPPWSPCQDGFQADKGGLWGSLDFLCVDGSESFLGGVVPTGLILLFPCLPWLPL